MPFDQDKIVQAILKAAMAVQGSDEQLARSLAESVVRAVSAEARDAIPSVESIQDMIEKVLIAQGHARTAKAFILYRANRSRIREGKSEIMEAVGDIVKAEAGAPGVAAGVPKLIAIGAAASREFYLNRVLSEAHAEAHLEGDWHIHGLSHYAIAPHGVALPYRRLLSGGFGVASLTFGTPRTAHEAAIATLALLQSAQCEGHGGVVIRALDADWAALLPPDTDDAALRAAMTALVLGLHAMPAQANGQLPEVTVQVGLDASALGRRVTRALLEAIADGLERFGPALRPHVVFQVQPGGADAEGLDAAIALACRWPGLTFVQDAAETAYLGHVARLTGDGDALSARVTLNLPRLALGARRDGVPFSSAIDEALESAAAQLRHRHQALAAHHGGGGGQLGIAFVGLAEALVAQFGQHHGQSEAARAEGVRLVEHLAARCATLSAEHGVRFVLLAGEGDEVASRFARLDRRRFGMIRGVTETAAYTAGAAVPAEAELPLSERLAIESAFGPHLAGGDVFVWQRERAPTPEALRDALNQAFAHGHRAFAVGYPVAVGEGVAARSLVRRRGYLALEG